MSGGSAKQKVLEAIEKLPAPTSPVTRVIWAPQAIQDVEAIRAHVARDSAHYAELVVERIVAAVERLQEHPRSGRMVPELGDASIREVELIWLNHREAFKDRGNEWLEVHHTIGGGKDEKHPERQLCRILLELDALVHGDQRVVLATHTPKKVAVFGASPATGYDGGDAVAFERGGEV